MNEAEIAKSLANCICTKIYMAYGKPFVITLDTEQANIVAEALIHYARRKGGKKRDAQKDVTVL